MAFRQSEIEQHDVALRRELDVGGFDVAVNDGRIDAVQIGQRIEQLIGPSQHSAMVERLSELLQRFFEVAAGHVFHHDVLPRAFVEQVAHFRQVRMRQACEQIGFALEDVAHLFGVEHAQLERNGAAAETPVAAFINRAHAALRNRSHDLITILQESCRRLHTEKPLSHQEMSE